jgi:hypothetical protein
MHVTGTLIPRAGTAAMDRIHDEHTLGVRHREALGEAALHRGAD